MQSCGDFIITSCITTTHRGYEVVAQPDFFYKIYITDGGIPSGEMICLVSIGYIGEDVASLSLMCGRLRESRECHEHPGFVLYAAEHVIPCKISWSARDLLVLDWSW